MMTMPQDRIDLLTERLGAILASHVNVERLCRKDTEVLRGDSEDTDKRDLLRDAAYAIWRTLDMEATQETAEAFWHAVEAAAQTQHHIASIPWL